MKQTNAHGTYRRPQDAEWIIQGADRMARSTYRHDPETDAQARDRLAFNVGVLSGDIRRLIEAQQPDLSPLEYNYSHLSHDDAGEVLVGWAPDDNGEAVIHEVWLAQFDIAKALSEDICEALTEELRERLDALAVADHDAECEAES